MLFRHMAPSTWSQLRPICEAFGPWLELIITAHGRKKFTLCFFLCFASLVFTWFEMSFILPKTELDDQRKIKIQCLLWLLQVPVAEVGSGPCGPQSLWLAQVSWSSEVCLPHACTKFNPHANEIQIVKKTSFEKYLNTVKSNHHGQRYS